MTSPSSALEVSPPSITPASSSSLTNLPSPAPPPSSSPASTSSSPPPTQPQPHPFSALLTPYSSSPLYPPSPPSPPPPPLSTLRCLLLSSSLPPPPPPPAFYNPQIPQTPYSPPPPTSSSFSSKREENIPRSRALCFRRTELTKAEWERERKGVEKWLRWCEGREIVLVSGGESVRKWVVDGGKEAMTMTAGGEFEGVERNEREVRVRERREREVKEREEQGVLAELREKSAWPKLGKWARGEENYTHLLPLHPPLHSLLTANVKVFTTIESMYSRYIHSFTNGTQSNALKLVWEKSPDAWRFMGSAVQDAWKNAPKNWEVLRKFAEGSVDDGGGGGKSSS